MNENAFRAWIETWPIWPLIRAFGFSAYVWLFLTVAAGMLASLPFVPGKLRGILNIVHRQGARWGLGFLLLHMLLLSLDPTMPFPWTAIVFPSFADARSAVYGLGIFAFYGLIIVMVTSGAVKVIGQAMMIATGLVALRSGVVWSRLAAMGNLGYDEGQKGRGKEGKIGGQNPRRRR
ncbi:MAG: hypothetical protein HSCHL_2270 [Hydrogenibacillus schlegelii]|uniref:Ferric oxidoreductase domain-containing protein n=1 Tax=Hydrogenibacillus schlegelii TaxID=1484 RepID=A0A2T5GES7_HYDSH|nr:hypothetical protein [Hydrogenibacillus schlegelii]PTQ54679.1 MAG: hypothetical protein HSCHL_2270 [Hydrogenibacillus schlegelii]